MGRTSVDVSIADGVYLKCIDCDLLAQGVLPVHISQHDAKRCIILGLLQLKKEFVACLCFLSRLKDAVALHHSGGPKAALQSVKATGTSCLSSEGSTRASAASSPGISTSPGLKLGWYLIDFTDSIITLHGRSICVGDMITYHVCHESYCIEIITDVVKLDSKT